MSVLQSSVAYMFCMATLAALVPRKVICPVNLPIKFHLTRSLRWRSTCGRFSGILSAPVVGKPRSHRWELLPYVFEIVIGWLHAGIDLQQSNTFV